MEKLNQFCRDVFHPGVHLYFSFNWVLALYAGLCLNHGHALVFSPSLIVAVLTLYLVLLFLRIMDELKDFEYDKIFNPDRPLVKKNLTHSDLYLYLMITCIGFLALNVLNGLEVLLILFFEIIYSWFLILLEKKSKLVREHMLVNLIFTYPVNIALSVYIVNLFYNHWVTDAIMEDALLVISFALAFLYYEFTRKIFYPSEESHGMRSYSSFLGFYPSLILSDLIALMSISLMVTLTQSWLPCLLLGIQLMRFIQVKKHKKITLTGSAFIGLFYGLWITLAFLDHFDFNFHFLIWP